jgi:hypothetical protein
MKIDLRWMSASTDSAEGCPVPEILELVHHVTEVVMVILCEIGQEAVEPLPVKMLIVVFEHLLLHRIGQRGGQKNTPYRRLLIRLRDQIVRYRPGRRVPASTASPGCAYLMFPLTVFVRDILYSPRALSSVGWYMTFPVASEKRLFDGYIFCASATASRCIRHEDAHCVAVEVCVEASADEGVDLNRAAR